MWPTGKAGGDLSITKQGILFWRCLTNVGSTAWQWHKIDLKSFYFTPVIAIRLLREKSAGTAGILNISY